MAQSDGTSSGGRSSLTEAAAALDAELREFEGRVELARKVKLTSEKNLAKAAIATTDAARGQEKVVARLRALIEAIEAARARQEAQAGELQERAQQIVRRRDEFLSLRERFDAVGAEARALNDWLQGAPQPAAAAEGKAELLGRLREAEARMARVIEGAGAVATACTEAGLEDVASDADSLQKQMQGARNKVSLSLRKLGV
jgi:chromosome segregation ATPase